MKQTTMKASVTESVCPHLGLVDDTATWYAFPTWENCCHRPAHPQSVDALYQSKMCLSRQHIYCPVFQEVGGWNGPLPEGIGRQRERKRGLPRVWIAITVVMLVIFAVSFAAFMLILGSS